MFDFNLSDSQFLSNCFIYSFVYDFVIGYMNPPVLVDINKDGVVDLVSAGFADKIEAFDGETLKILWTYNKVGTETYS